MNHTNAEKGSQQEMIAAGRLKKNLYSVLEQLKRMPILLMLIVIWIIFICLSENFLTVNNMITLFVANAYFAVAAAGETFVIMTGGIDLSIAQVLTCSAIISAKVMIFYQTSAVNAIVNSGGAVLSFTELRAQPGIDRAAVNDAILTTTDTTILIGLLVALGVGLLFGIINGISIGVFNMTFFTITLATQLLARGISFVLSNGISIPGTPRELTKMSYAYGIHIGEDVVLPWIILIMVVVILLCGILLGKTLWGRSVTLLGSNEQAAKYVGINVPLIKASAYMLSGLLGGMAGFLSIMALGTADPKVGDPLLISIIGGVILGGIGMKGGEGNMGKAALGILLFATLINGMTFLNLSLAFQQIILGSIIIVGMTLLARLKTRKG